MSQIKDIDTYTIESPILEVGTFTDSKGEKVTLDEDVLSEIYHNIKDTTPGKAIHDGKPIAEVKKYILSSDGKKIIQKSLITDPKTFKEQQKNGFKYISPEIQLDSVNGRVVGATYDGWALSNNPGMIKTPYTTSIHHFDAPEGTTPPTPTDSWADSFSEITKKIDNLNESINKINQTNIDKTKQETPIMTPVTTPEPITPTVQPTISMTPEELQNLIKGAVAEAVKGVTPEVTPEVTTEVKAPITESPTSSVPPELAEKLAKLEAEHSKLLKRQRDERFAELTKLGIAEPKKLVDDSMSMETQLMMLDKYKEAFAIKTPMSAPITDVSSVGGSTADKNYVDISSALAAVGINSPNNEVHRRMMEDLTKEQFGIFAPLFDESGKYIGN